MQPLTAIRNRPVLLPTGLKLATPIMIVCTRDSRICPSLSNCAPDIQCHWVHGFSDQSGCHHALRISCGKTAWLDIRPIQCLPNHCSKLEVGSFWLLQDQQEFVCNLLQRSRRGERYWGTLLVDPCLEEPATSAKTQAPHL